MGTLNQNIVHAINDFDAIKESIEAKGVEIPEDTPTSDYYAKILEIETGITPSGAVDILENGETDVTNYATANVNVPQGVFPEGTLDISENGEFDVTNYANVNVNLPFEQKTATPSITQQVIQPSEGYEALSQVTVEPAPLESVTVTPTTSQQTFTPTAPNIGFESATVEPAPLDTVTITPTTEDQTVTPEPPYIGFSSITVERYIPPEPPSIEGKSLILIDYDGTPLYAYTKAEALALTALPTTAGKHDQLTFDEWNWSLADIKDFLTTYNTYLYVGALYTINESGISYYWFEILEGDNKHLELTFYDSSAQVTVNWGDGTTETATASASHTYSTSGVYCVTTNGEYALSAISFPMKTRLKKAYLNYRQIYEDLFNGSFGLEKILLRKDAYVYGFGFLSCHSLKAIVIKDGVLRGSSLSYCSSLEIVSSGKNNTWFAGSAPNCPSLKQVIFQTTVSHNPASAFVRAYSLNSAVLMNGTSGIGESMFSECFSLQSIKIPSSVTQIKTQAFYNAYCLESIDLTDFTTSDNTVILGNSAFGSISSNAVFWFSSQAVIDKFINDSAEWARISQNYSMQVKGA